jgi:hypothetical protein
MHPTHVVLTARQFFCLISLFPYPTQSLHWLAWLWLPRLHMSSPLAHLCTIPTQARQRLWGCPLLPAVVAQRQRDAQPHGFWGVCVGECWGRLWPVQHLFGGLRWGRWLAGRGQPPGQRCFLLQWWRGSGGLWRGHGHRRRRSVRGPCCGCRWRQRHHGCGRGSGRSRAGVMAGWHHSGTKPW